MQEQFDIDFMQKAISLAKRAEGMTCPNPPVGAVVVCDGKVIGAGYHKKAGTPHAEVLAIKSAGIDNCKNATIYVTLEPCSTYGRTPPCTEAIIDAGFQRVVVGICDPNPQHAGYGIDILRKAGITVDVNILKDAAKELLAPFAKLITTNHPLVSLKLGMTLDGRIADANYKSQWITGAKARQRVQKLRKRADAIMVGCGTVCADNPSLLCRLRKSPVALRVIVDSTGKTPLTSKILTDGFADKTVIATTKRCPEKQIDAYNKLGADVWVMPSIKDKVSLKSLMTKLGKYGVMNVLCEGGGVLAEALAKSNLVDEYLIFMAPKILGGQAIPAFGGLGWKLGKEPGLEFTDVERVGADLFIRAVKGN